MVKSIVTAGIEEQFEKLARILKRSGAEFEPGTEAKFGQKWDELMARYAAENPGQTPPLLEFGPDLLLRPRWPRGWERVQS